MSMEAGSLPGNLLIALYDEQAPTHSRRKKPMNWKSASDEPVTNEEHRKVCRADNPDIEGWVRIRWTSYGPCFGPQVYDCPFKDCQVIDDHPSFE